MNPARRRSSITMRVTPELRERIKTAARHSGRSLGQEVEHRVKRSFLPDLFATMQETGREDGDEENLLRAIGRPLRAALELLLPKLHSIEIALLNADETNKGTEYRAFSEKGWKTEKGRLS